MCVCLSAVSCVPQAFLSAVAWHALEAGCSGACRYPELRDSALSGRNAFACDRGRAFWKDSLQFRRPVGDGVRHRIYSVSAPRIAP